MDLRYVVAQLMANFVPLISHGVYEHSSIFSGNGFNGRQSAVKCTRDAQQIQFSAVAAAAAAVAAFRTACERARESRLDNNARTGYRETVAAKPRSGSRRCLN